MGSFKDYASYYATPLIIYITPIILIPLIVIPTEGKELSCAFVLLLMGTYWCTEVIPLGVTALIPIFLLPLFDIMGTKQVCMSFMENTTMILVGGLIMAIGVEKSSLHRRIAINVLKLIGASPRWLMLGFMLPTWFLSMWISNTATTAMMMPIVQEVIDKLQAIRTSHKEGKIKADGHQNGKIKSTSDAEVEMERITQKYDDKSKETDTFIDNNNKDAEEGQPLDKQFVELSKALTICVAFAANAGGTGTLIGTPVNLVLKGQADELWRLNGLDESPINFTTWLVMGFPLSLLNLIVIWIWLEIFFIGPREFCGCFKSENSEEDEKEVKNIIDREHKDLGRLRVDEIEVLILFCILVLLWFFRAPGFMPGWGEHWEKGIITDALPAVMMSVILFTIPSKYPKNIKKGGKADTLITWKQIKDHFPWDVVLLLGGGFALAEGTKASGLSAWLGEKMAGISSLPDALVVIILGIFVTFLTQFTSNLASASIMLPIVISMSKMIGRNPLYLMLPVTIASQYAFMLPVATPPNAVAFSTGRIRVIDMIKAGTVLNFLCVLVMALAMNTWLVPYFDLNTIPWETQGAKMNLTDTVTYVP